MADSNFTSDDIHKLIDSLNANTRAVLKGTNSSEKIAKEEKRDAHKAGSSTTRNHATPVTGDAAIIKKLIAEQNKLAGATQAISQKFTKVSVSTDSAIKTFQHLAVSGGSLSKTLTALAPSIGRMAGAIGIITKIASVLDDTTKTYRELTQAGQTFNGSMLQMQIAAAEAALPLQEFAEVIKKNSTVIASIGTSSFMSMSKQLRISLKDVGQLGLTSAQLNANLGQYLDTQRLYGNLSNQSTEKTTANVRALGIETLKAAQMTGVHTDKINESAQAALKDETLRAKMLQLSANSVDNYGLALNKAVIYMSALPGEAGKTLSNMLAQTAGRGSAILSDASQTFIDAGMFGVTDLMDNMSKKVANGTWNDQDAADFNRKFVAEGMKNMASLQMQAATGNQAAKQAIVMISEMQEIAKKTPEELKAQKGVTNFLQNFGLLIDRISGLIRERFFKGLEALMTKFEGFTDSPAFAAFSEKIGDMAERFGKFLSETITPERLIAFGGGLAAALEGAVKFATVVAGVVDTVATAFGWLSDKIGVVGTALVAFAAWQTAKVAAGAVGNGVGRVRELLAERFNIGKGSTAPLTQGGVQSAFEHALAKFSAGNALRVLLPGSGLGGNDGSDIDLDRDNKKKKSRTRRRGRTARDRLGARIHTPRTPHIPELPHNAPHQLPHNAPHIPEPHVGQQRFHLPEYHDNSISSRLKQSTLRGTQATRTGAARVMSHGKSAVVHGLQFGQRAASKATKVGRAAVSRASGLARSGVSKVASLGKAGLSNAGSLLKGAATGGKLATGALTAAKLLGPAAIGTVATMAFDKFMPDFKGKATMSAMAQGASMGAMLGPIGAAVGAGAGAIYANWDEITDTVSTAFKGIKDFDYTGAIKSAGKYLAPLGGALSMGATIIYDNWGTIKDTVSSGFEAIASFDYAGAFTKAASFLSPIADGVKWYVDTIWNSWKQVGSFISDGFGKVKNFLFGGDDATKKAGDLSKPLSDKFGAFSNTNSLIGGAGLGMGSMPNVNAPISLTPNAGVDLFGNQQPGPSIAAPVTPATPPAPKINTDHVTAHTAGWKEQTLQLQKENLETRKQMAQLMDVLANGNDKTVGGLRDLIGEQQKSNRNLDVISGSII